MSNLSSPGNARQHKKTKHMTCMFCRRSHVVCNKQRPCSLCIKRGISHLCATEESTNNDSDTLAISPTQENNNDNDNEKTTTTTTTTTTNNNKDNDNNHNANNDSTTISNSMNNIGLLFPPQSFVSENAVSEFSSINEFLSILEEPLVSLPQGNGQLPEAPLPDEAPTGTTTTPQEIDKDTATEPSKDEQTSAREHFFMTAADPGIEVTPEERLKLVIDAKVGAELLKPYNYGKGYTRLQEYMDLTMSPESHKRVLRPLSSIRPAFRSIARSLKDVDLVLVEEAFERMLISYDRVFTSMSMPACLWRRTGEIYRANKEFASIIGRTVDDLRDGKFAIYELMNEESSVNYWEKYGSIAFDKGQKAVLTTCTLRNEDKTEVECCFSFTIRRDRYNMPMCIVGNFIPIVN
ncbi:regulator of drug sensitivity 2 [Monosporozyma servazzii]